MTDDFLGLKWKASFLSKNNHGSFLGNFWKNFGYFLFQHLVTLRRWSNLPLLTKEHDTFQTVKIFYFKTDSQTIFICWDTYITYTFGDGLTEVWGGNKCVVMLMKLQIKVGIIAKGGTT